MRGKNVTEPEALIFDPDPELRRDLQIFLVRCCGLTALGQEEVRDYDPSSACGLKLLITSGFDASRCGLRLIRRIRELGLETFVLYLDRKSTPDEGGDAFAAGADDVIRLPFTLREFGLRLRARLGAEFIGSGALAGLVPQVMVDAENRLLAAGTSAFAQLTRAEAEVMAVLIRKGGELVTRDDFSRAIDDCDWIYGDRKFDVHVAKIRKKLMQAFGSRYVVRSIRSEGYALCEVPAGGSSSQG